MSMLFGQQQRQDPNEQAQARVARFATEVGRLPASEMTAERLFEIAGGTGAKHTALLVDDYLKRAKSISSIQKEERLGGIDTSLAQTYGRTNLRRKTVVPRN